MQTPINKRDVFELDLIAVKQYNYNAITFERQMDRREVGSKRSFSTHTGIFRIDTTQGFDPTSEIVVEYGNMVIQKYQQLCGKKLGENQTDTDYVLAHIKRDLDARVNTNMRIPSLYANQIEMVIVSGLMFVLHINNFDISSYCKYTDRKQISQ